MNFYQHAATILDKLDQRKGTIKGLVIGDPKVKDKKKMYALVCETLKCKVNTIATYNNDPNYSVIIR